MPDLSWAEAISGRLHHARLIVEVRIGESAGQRPEVVGAEWAE